MSAFLDLTRSRYAAMKTRLKGLPFDLGEFRVWHLALLKHPDGYCHCVYCNRPLDITTLRLDHGLPIERGGGKELADLLPTCDEDNRIKGQMTAVEFRRFLDFIRELGPAAESDIRRRLKTGEGFMRLRHYSKHKTREVIHG